ncbi:hypothetical protein CDL15_Pgr024831 [Punica granatum]|uniref:Uncharacterized protein n=1 Tax=Punica granatum TaxID=22663 RepID=A0A218WJZ1_PUNGR|nr:hypothetical protein CDL15_Pgr024831 [Punica granatum]
MHVCLKDISCEVLEVKKLANCTESENGLKTGGGSLVQPDTRKASEKSGDSVERLEGCSGAKDARSAKIGAREDVRRADRHAGVRARRGARVVRGSAQVCSSKRERAGDVRACAATSGYGCTVHPRAHPSPGMMELT